MKQPTYKKKMTGTSAGTFEGTKQAFGDLISRKEWYTGIQIDGRPITTSNAAQIKRKYTGKVSSSISQDYMENILLAAGYKIVQPILWQK